MANENPFVMPEVRMAPNANVRMSGGLPLSDPMVNFSTPQRGLPWGPDAFAGPGGLPLGPGRDGAPSRGDQLQFRNWVPAFWPPGVSEPDVPTEPPPDEAPPPREEFTYPTETIPQAEPPPIPDFLNHPNTQMLPSGQYMPNMRWLPPLRPMENERQGYDAGGSIAGIPFGGGGQPSMSMDQLNQQYPMAQSMWGNPELLRPLTQMFENIQVPGEIGPAEQLRGMSQFPFQNLGRTMGLSPMSSGEIWQRMMETGHVPGRGAEEVFSYMMQDPGNSNRIWEYMDPTWPVDMPAPSQPTPEPQPEPEPEPGPTTPPPRREYTYPTETLPQAEPPPIPGFLQGHSAQQSGGMPRWIPPIRPISGQTFNQQFMPRAYGGATHGPGQASGPEQARPNAALAAHIARFQERFGQRFADGGAINRARLRAVVSAKRGDFNG